MQMVTEHKRNQLEKSSMVMSIQLDLLKKFDTLVFENVILGTLLLDESHYDSIRFRVSSQMFSAGNSEIAKIIFEMLGLGERLRKFEILQLAKEKGYTSITSEYIDTIMYSASEDSFQKSVEMFILNWYSYNKALNAVHFISDIQTGIDARIAAAKLNKSDSEIEMVLENSDENKYDFIEQIENTLTAIYNKAQGIETDGILTGFTDFDTATGGFLNGNLYIIGGESGGGKSTLGLQMVSQAANDNFQTDFYSLEMTYRQIIPKILSAKTGVSTLNMRVGNLSDNEQAYILDTAQIVKSNMKMSIIDDVFDIDEIERIAKIRRKRNDTRLMIIDHLGIIKTKSKSNNDVVYDDMAYRLKRLAKELDIPIVLLAQKNRNSLVRANKKPMTGDLKYGGAAAADVIIFPYRPDFNEDERMYSEEVECSIVITKNRETGTLGEFKRIFVDRYNMYCEIDNNNRPILPNTNANKIEFEKELSGSNLISRQYAAEPAGETPF